MILVGALTPTGATITTRVTAGTAVRVAYRNGGAWSYSSSAIADSDGFARCAITSADPATEYEYALEVGGSLGSVVGTFATLPVEGEPASFTIAHASCTSYYDVAPSNHRVYDAIKARNPLMFHMLGDLDYSDMAMDNPAAMRTSLLASLETARASAMWADVPMTYVWDDHDFGPDNSDGTFVGKASRAAIYRQMFPHYALPDAGAVNQAWTVGRVRFIQTDLRYYRSPNGTTDNSSKTALGATQKAWLKSELLAAKNGPLTVWLNSQVWSVPSSGWAGIDTDGDHWGAFSTERAEISDYLADNGITNVIQLTGDQHALAIRRTVDYSTAQTAPMRIYSAAALDALPLARNGGWDEIHTGRGQYGTLSVDDDGTELTVTWQGWQVDPATGVETLVMADSFTSALVQRTARAWNGSAWVARPIRSWDGSAWASRPVYSHSA